MVQVQGYSIFSPYLLETRCAGPTLRIPTVSEEVRCLSTVMVPTGSTSNKVVVHGGTDFEADLLPFISWPEMTGDGGWDGRKNRVVYRNHVAIVHPLF